jgi:hypothetical protein
MRVKFSNFPNTTPRRTVPEHTICQLAIHSQDPEQSRNASALSNGSGSLFGRQHISTTPPADLDCQKSFLTSTLMRSRSVPCQQLRYPLPLGYQAIQSIGAQIPDETWGVKTLRAPGPTPSRICCAVAPAAGGARMQVRWKAGLQ